MKEQNNKHDKLITTVLLFLTVHLFGTHSRLLYHLNPDKKLQLNATELAPFSFVHFDENTITAMVFAIAYSAMTAIILKLYDSTMKFFAGAVAIFAILDFTGVWIYYDIDMPGFYAKGSLYYAAYTFVIILAIGYHRYNVKPKQTINTVIEIPENGHSIEENILILREKNYNQKQIAAQLNLSESKVSRVIKKLEISK
jgi:hypothetical protein